MSISSSTEDLINKNGKRKIEVLKLICNETKLDRKRDVQQYQNNYMFNKKLKKICIYS